MREIEARTARQRARQVPPRRRGAAGVSVSASFSSAAASTTADEALRQSAELLGVDVREFAGGNAASGGDVAAEVAAELDMDAGLALSAGPRGDDYRLLEEGDTDGDVKLTQRGRLRMRPLARSPTGSAEAGLPLQEVHYDDGKKERTYAGGLRCVLFSNGTCKEAAPGGDCSVWFGNGDAKHTLGEDGRVEYYYSSVDTWHCTYCDGVEVFFFPSGQIEAHLPSGEKEIIFIAAFGR